MRLGMVIQGPLVSRGRHGASAGIVASKVTNADIVSHDCRADIEQLVRSTRDFFDAGIVIATWQGEMSTEIPGAHRLDLPPLAVPIRGRKWHEAVAANNKLRQFQSSLAGTKWLQEAGADIVVKTRTDTRLDVQLLAKFTADEVKKSPNKIVVPWLPRQTKSPRIVASTEEFAIPDFYFGGLTDQLLKFFYAQVWSGHADFAESVHLDVPLRYAFALDHYLGLSLPRLSGMPLAYFMGPRPSSSNRRVLYDVIAREFVAGPRSVWEGLIWRGQPMAQTDSAQRLFDGHWHISDTPERAPRWCERLQDAIFTGYGRAERLYAFATSKRVWGLVLADHLVMFVLFPTKFLMRLFRDTRWAWRRLVPRAGWGAR